jgi:ketosteroid isomerase-like protein
MPSIGQENLETVMIDFLGALRRGDFEAAAGLLDPDVSWQGLREDWVCHGREEVVDTFRWGLEQRREIDALEFTRGGEHVVLGARGPNIGPEEEPLGQIFNVFTLRDGRIVRIDDYRGRSEALEAAGVAGDVGCSADELVDHFVQAARAAGCSSAEIGSTLGVSKQAAQQRFVTVAPTGEAWPPGLDDGAGAAFASAAGEARADLPARGRLTGAEESSRDRVGRLRRRRRARVRAARLEARDRSARAGRSPACTASALAASRKRAFVVMTVTWVHICGVKIASAMGLPARVARKTDPK